MTVYFETSSVLRWLFGEPDAEMIASIIDGAEHVVTSVLTALETQRALIRAETLGLLSPADVERLRGRFSAASMQWSVLSVTDEVLFRAGKPFPRETARSLDAVYRAPAFPFIVNDHVNRSEKTSVRSTRSASNASSNSPPRSPSRARHSMRKVRSFSHRPMEE